MDVQKGVGKPPHSSMETQEDSSWIIWGITFSLQDPWIRFFLAMEDPEDGYRSALGDLYQRWVRKEDFQSGMEPLKGTMTIAPDGEQVMFTSSEGKELLVIGTDMSDDYYPSFVSDWDPPERAEEGTTKGD